MIPNAQESLNAMIDLWDANTRNKSGGNLDQASYVALRKELINKLEVTKTNDTIYTDIVNNLGVSEVREFVSGKDDEELLLQDSFRYSVDDFAIPIIVNVDVPPINQYSTQNRMGMIWYHTLKYLRTLLIQGAKDDDQDDLYMRLKTLYTKLNVESMFYNPELFESFIQTQKYQYHDQMLLNISREIDRFLKNLSSEIQYISTAFRELTKDIRGEGSEQNTLDKLKRLNPEFVTYYKKLIFGSDSATSKNKESYVCGSCGETVYVDSPIISIDSMLISKQVEPKKIRNYIKITPGFCPHCGKCNIFPSEYLNSLVSVMTEINSEVKISSKQNSTGTTQIVSIGSNILDRVEINFRDKEYSDIELMGDIIQSETPYLPEIERPDFETLTTFPDIDFSNSHGFEELLQETCEDLSLLHPKDIILNLDSVDNYYDDKIEIVSNYGSRVVDVSPIMDNTLTSAQRSLLTDINSQYEGQFINFTPIDGNVIVDYRVSKYLRGFARLFLQNRMDLGYSESDALRSILSQDKPYFLDLSRIRDLTILKRLLHKIKIIVPNIGYDVGCNIQFNVKNLINIVRSLAHYEVVEFPYLEMVDSYKFEELDFTIVKVGEGEHYQALKEKVLEEIKQFDCSEKLRTAMLSALELLNSIAMDYTGEGLNKPYCFETVALYAICEIIPPCIDEEIKSIENRILTDIVEYAKKSSIVKQDYDVDLKSPIYFVSNEFKSRILDKVYCTLLKNTLCKVHIENFMGLKYKLGVQEPLANYLNFIKSAARYFQGKNVSDFARVLFNTATHNCIRVVNANAVGEITYPYVDYKLVENASVDMKILNTVTRAFRDQEVYNTFISNVVCDVVNICQDEVMFENITGLDSTIINRPEDSDVSTEDMESNIALMYGTPKISEEDSRAVNELISDLDIEGVSRLFPGDNIESDYNTDYFGFDFEDDDVESERDTVARAQRLMLIFNADLLPVKISKQFEDAISKYESHNN